MRTSIDRRGRAPESPIGRLACGVAALVILAGASAGCSTTATSDVEPIAHDYRLRHPIMISNEPEVLDLPVGMRGPAVSPEIEDAIRVYVAGYRQNGTGGITIQTPTGSANEIAAASTGRAVHYALVSAGVPRGQIIVAPYHVGNHAKASALRLSYLRVKAVTPKCGLWPETGVASFENENYHNFGCAGQQNLAAMVANPADLVQPRPMTPASGARRAKVITDYSQGAETRSEAILLDTSISGAE